MLFAGNMRETLSVYKVVERQTASGEHSASEELKFTTRAQKIQDKGFYTIDAEELFHVDRPRFVMRPRKVTETDIVVWRDSRYRITNIDRNIADMTLTLEKIND